MKPRPQSASAPRPTGTEAQTILIAVTGMSPTVLIETVWALAFPGDRTTAPTLPARVIALTTTVGREAIAQQLFGTDVIWERLRAAVLGPAYQTDPRLCFGTTGDCVKVFTVRTAGRPVELKDISSASESAAVADFITEELWGFVEKPEARIIASIPGGFKTMCALLFAGMSLLARKDDLISHVLVNTPYDTALTPQFFFPAQPEQELRDRDGTIWHARNAQLRLGFVPFVPMHDLLEKYRKPRSYTDLVERCRVNLDPRLRQPVRLRLRLSPREVEINGTVGFKLAPQPFLFLWFLAERARQSVAPLGKYFDAMAPFEEFLEQRLCQWQVNQRGWITPGKKLLPEGFAKSLDAHDDPPIGSKLLWGITQTLRQVLGRCGARAMPATARSLRPRNSTGSHRDSRRTHTSERLNQRRMEATFHHE